MAEHDRTIVPQLLGDYYTRIYRIKKMIRSPKTAYQAHLAFKRFGEIIGKVPTIHDLTDDNLCLFISVRLGDGLASHTVDKEVDKLKAVANYAARKRHIAEFPEVPQIRPCEQLPQAWDESSVHKLLSACKASLGTIAGSRAADFWVAYHYVALTTGERTGAMLSLRWDWLQGCVLRVPAEARKARKPMTYILPRQVVAVVERLRKAGREKIFETDRTIHTFWLWYGKLLKRAGLPSGRKWKPHALRRTFATFLERSGGDATRALGHTDRRVTVTSYLDAGLLDAGKESPGDSVARSLEL